MKNVSKIVLTSISALLLVSCGDSFLTRDPYGSTITQFIKQASQTLHNYNPDLIVSCALMPETVTYRQLVI